VKSTQAFKHLLTTWQLNVRFVKRHLAQMIKFGVFHAATFIITAVSIGGCWESPEPAPYGK